MAAIHDITGLTRADLAGCMEQLGEPTFRTDQILRWIYSQRCQSFDRMTDLSKSLRDQLSEVFTIRALRQSRVQGSDDTTRKYLFKLADGQFVETVLIPASPALYGAKSDRHTLCVSSQVGCAFDCKFCASGLAGLSRNLQTSEIVGQVLDVEAESGRKVNNIVFMGMGEPLANYNNVCRAIEIINAKWGVGIGARHICVSTSGLAPQIRKFADFPLQVRLAVSLHGATDEVRDKIMPVNKRFPITELMDALQEFRGKKKQRITFEYILIAGVNDDLKQAKRLVQLARLLQARVNLIPYNAIEGLEWKRPSEEQQNMFLKTVNTAGVSATLRREKGHDIDAACGQLRLRKLRDDE